MDKEKIVKSNQEQATAAWINYLNQYRINEMMAEFQNIDSDLFEALGTIDSTMEAIKDEIVDRGRGGLCGMHGFIAEAAECGIGNAEQQVLGKADIYEWVNNNGPEDIKRGADLIQQKFYNADLSLGAIREHLKKYPDYLDNNGCYQIPKNQYEKIKEYLEMPPEVANKMATSNGEFSLKEWKRVNDFFEKGDIPFDKVEPAHVEYSEVQRGTYEDTLVKEKKELRDTSKERRKESYDSHKPTVKEAAKATVVSAAIEGGMTFCMEIRKKIKDGKAIKDLTVDDWNEILKVSGIGTVKGGIRGTSIYVLNNYTATPAFVASALVTSGFGIAEQAYLLRNGEIDESEFIANAEMICLDASISAISSLLGQAIIPIPVVGAVVGNTVGTYMYQLAKDSLNEREKNIIKRYVDEQHTLDEKLEQQYRECLNQLMVDFEFYISLIESAFSEDILEAFDGSIELARENGVNEDEILKNISDIDDLFLN